MISPIDLSRMNLVLLKLRTLDLFVIPMCKCRCIYMHKIALSHSHVSWTSQPSTPPWVAASWRGASTSPSSSPLFLESSYFSQPMARTKFSKQLAWISLMILHKWDLTVGTQGHQNPSAESQIQLSVVTLGDACCSQINIPGTKSCCCLYKGDQGHPIWSCMSTFTLFTCTFYLN